MVKLIYDMIWSIHNRNVKNPPSGRNCLHHKGLRASIRILCGILYDKNKSLLRYVLYFLQPMVASILFKVYSAHLKKVTTNIAAKFTIWSVIFAYWPSAYSDSNGMYWYSVVEYSLLQKKHNTQFKRCPDQNILSMTPWPWYCNECLALQLALPCFCKLWTPLWGQDVSIFRRGALQLKWCTGLHNWIKDWWKVLNPSSKDSTQTTLTSASTKIVKVFESYNPSKILGDL